MGRKEDVFEQALKNKNIPVLTLDHKWHLLFNTADTTTAILKLEDKLNTLLKRQGKLNTETKDIRKLKKKLMDEIVPMVDELEQSPSPKLDKKIEEHKRLISECNDKMEQYKQELMELPAQIETANYELMLATMDACYDTLKENTKEIEEIGNWIDTIRIELKKKIIRKQEKEEKNHDLYNYMHAIFGADVINLFDMKYNPETQHPKKAEKKPQDSARKPDTKTK
ncbi:MAG: hypothetical protein J1E65_00870 [Lachnospiraceae bacterium]|nr:hypothetical protein [Lachnospiraceae bacterium]